MYDLSLATNSDAYLPVTISLIKLSIKSTVDDIVQKVQYYVGGVSINEKPEGVGQRLPVKGAIPVSETEFSQDSEASNDLDGLLLELSLFIFLIAAFGILFLLRRALLSANAPGLNQAQPQVSMPVQPPQPSDAHQSSTSPPTSTVAPTSTSTSASASTYATAAPSSSGSSTHNHAHSTPPTNDQETEAAKENINPEDDPGSIAESSPK
jgi:cytoskeletal protein RodZ